MSLSPYTPLALAKQSTTTLAQNPPTSDLVQVYADSDGLVKTRKRKADGTVTTLYLATSTAAHTASDTVLTVSGTQNVYNKTIYQPIIDRPTVSAYWRMMNQANTFNHLITSQSTSTDQGISIPDNTGTLALRDVAQTFTGVQTFGSAPVLSTKTLTVSGTTVTVPAGTDTLVNLTGTQTLQNKTVTAELFFMKNSAGTRAATFSALPITGTQQFFFPNLTGIFCLTAGTQTVSDKTVDNTNTVTLKDTLFTLQDDGDTTKQLQFELSGITTGTTRTLTVPNATDTLAVLLAAQTLKAKTINGASNTVSNVCDSPYIAVVTNSSGQTVTTATLTRITFNTATVNKGSCFASNVFTAPVTGVYLMTACVRWENSSIGRRELYIRSSAGGVAANDDYTSHSVVANTTHRSNFARILPLTAGQVMEVAVYHTRGADDYVGSATEIDKSRATFVYLGAQS